ncbi:tetratricopeptide repeat-containing sensor histidine kinase [Leeuwenhoekiella marinoflava]|uniref:Tetratricopeptide repeat protein n=2 Tax=Leeuwenhoekiella marinoflava TaxID=988 RepID=A0A4Q0PP77_9FLAO|nr:tetratricopeptide repeat protein [Leeuwenhoekiella marinoflava]RXG32337.1 tetratricopeptide repeat protein [Leeuwenhoekiella marinoflava]SHE78649.1 Tetratricopeptide repeat-containing protein [Leeuwenhoekiella marinoflava DSM 3653]
MKLTLYIFLLLFSLQLQAQINLDSIVVLRKNQPQNAIIEIDKLLFSKRTADSLIPYLHKESGYAYQNLNDIDKAITLLEKAKNGFNPKTQAEQLMNVEIQLSNNFSRLNKQSEAIQYGNKALQRAEELKNKELVVKANDNMSYVYFKLGQLDKAISYLQVSKAYHLEHNNQAELSVNYNNLAILYRNKGDLQRCISYNQKSLAINRKLKDMASVAKSYNNLGIVYNQLNNTEKATSYFTKAISLNDSLKINNSNPLISLARLQHQQNDLQDEEKTLLKALELEEKTGRLDMQKSLYQSLLNNSLEQNNPLIAKSYQSIIERIDAELALRQKEENLQLIDTHKQLLENELKWREQQQRTMTYQWIALSVFLLALAFGIYFYQRQSKKDLVRQKERALLENKVLRSQMNPHFIFNALTAIQNTVMNKNPLDAASYIAKFAKLIRQNFDFVQKEWISLEEDLDALQNYMETQKFRFNHSFEYDILVQTQEAPGNLNIPPMLLQPFVENAIEHGLKKSDKPGKIVISVNQENEKCLHFTIEDNGKGYTPTSDNKLHATQIIKERLKIHNPSDATSFKIQSLGKNKGTRVAFSLSLKS